MKPMFNPVSLSLVIMVLSGMWGVPAVALAEPARPMVGPAAATQTPAGNVSETPAQTAAFNRAMRLGYEASAQFDYNTALINFRRALAIRPTDAYAQVAAENMEFYLQRDRMARIQQEISRLEGRLAQANQQKDWVCAAATVDELVTYTDPNSLNRERLLGYRGELSGLIAARTDLASWSTICTPPHPLY